MFSRSDCGALLWTDSLTSSREARLVRHANLADFSLPIPGQSKPRRRLSFLSLSITLHLCIQHAPLSVESGDHPSYLSADLFLVSLSSLKQDSLPLSRTHIDLALQVQAENLALRLLSTALSTTYAGVLGRGLWISAVFEEFRFSSVVGDPFPTCSSGPWTTRGGGQGVVQVLEDHASTPASL